MKDKLNIYSNNITSQHGEDGILNYIISNLLAIILHNQTYLGHTNGIDAHSSYSHIVHILEPKPELLPVHTVHCFISA